MCPPLNISGSYINVVARRLGGAGIPGGEDANLLKDWCNLFSPESEQLQEELYN